MVGLFSGGRSGLVVSAVNSGSSGPGSSPVAGSLRCVIGQDTLQCLSPPRSINGYQQTVRET